MWWRLEPTTLHSNDVLGALQEEPGQKEEMISHNHAWSKSAATTHVFSRIALHRSRSQSSLVTR